MVTVPLPLAAAGDVVTAAGVAAHQSLGFENLQCVGSRLPGHAPFLGQRGNRRRWQAGFQLARLDPCPDICGDPQVDPRVLVVHGNDGS